MTSLPTYTSVTGNGLGKIFCLILNIGIKQSGNFLSGNLHVVPLVQRVQIHQVVQHLQQVQPHQRVRLVLGVPIERKKNTRLA